MPPAGNSAANSSNRIAVGLVPAEANRQVSDGDTLPAACENRVHHPHVVSFPSGLPRAGAQLIS
jgi:hypothetical protein